jgi:uncharacterized protein YndB with AHSA1/START domain
MRLDLKFEEHFDQSIEEVWEALTDPQLLAAWLMENDFEARVGKRFTFRRTSPMWSGVFECEVLELDPPHHMVWSWSAGDEPEGPSRVVFELRAVADGTLLTLRHMGSAGDRTGEVVTERWPAKLAELRALFDAARRVN